MNNLKERLRQGKKVTGAMVTLFDNPDLAQILKVCGYDFFIVDCEHGSFDFAAVAKLFGLARMAGIPGLVRINEVKREAVLKYMDAGAAGILLPSTETVEQAKALVEYAKYAPLGNRGVSLTRMHTGYEKVTPVDYMKKSNEETILMLQIESVAGVENIDQLMAVEGIDAAFVGPNDLTQDMGIMGQKDHPRFIEAVDKIIASAKKNNKFSGIHLMSTDELEVYIKKGMTLNLWSSDVNLLMTLAKEGLSKLNSI
jgi:2-dehydro-3-deoxyglucarate aldolase/4-hydroxy-2-oxoheptanedioate aldolase